MQNNEPFEVRKIKYRHNCGGIGYMFDVEIYYPHKFHSVCYQILGRDEMDVYNQIQGRHNNVRGAQDKCVESQAT